MLLQSIERLSYRRHIRFGESKVSLGMMIFWSALPDLNRGPPDGCLQPCVSSLQSGALAN